MRAYLREAVAVFYRTEKGGLI